MQTKKNRYARIKRFEGFFFEVSIDLSTLSMIKSKCFYFNLFLFGSYYYIS